MTIVYKCSIDLFFYVVGSSQENEVGNVLQMQKEYKARLVLQRLHYGPDPDLRSAVRMQLKFFAQILH